MLARDHLSANRAYTAARLPIMAPFGICPSRPTIGPPHRVGFGGPNSVDFGG
jgi:hypothetical protein